MALVHAGPDGEASADGVNARRVDAGVAVRGLYDICLATAGARTAAACLLVPSACQ